MNTIFPVLVKEIETGDVYTFQSLEDFKIFIEESMDILDEFHAWSSDGLAIKLNKDILGADDLDDFFDNNK